MFHAAPIPILFVPSPRPCNPALRNLTPIEALRIMPSAINRSAAFEQLALPLLASLYNHAYWVTRNQAEAEDLVQETFTKALRTATTPDLRIIAVSDVNPADLDNLMAALVQAQESLQISK